MTQVPPELPSELGRFFWDIDPAGLDPQRNARFVIERLLEYGNAPAIAWLTGRYDADQIRDVVRSSRRLGPKTATLWARHLGLQEDQVCALRQPFLARSWRS